MARQNPLPSRCLLDEDVDSRFGSDTSTQVRMARYTVVMSLSSYVFEAYDDMSNAEATFSAMTSSRPMAAMEVPHGW